MKKQTTNQADELARARLAYVSIGQPSLTAPRRAADKPDAPLESDQEPPPDQHGAPVLPEPPDAEHKQMLASWRDALALKRAHVVALAMVLAVVAVTLGLTFSKSNATEVALQPELATSDVPGEQPTPAKSQQVSSPSVSPSPATIRVHVAGAVSSPGVVTLPAEAIVVDAIQAAGGLTDEAVPGDLNLAAPVTAGMQVKVGRRGDESHIVAAEGAAAAGDAASTGNDGSGSDKRVNLNTATAQQLEALPGVGPVTAAAIVAWREEHGGFTAPTELQEVTGIGPKTFSKLEPHITV
ncbi:helix-hairpin-helix domain-containing protein [uncultured Tessaracoccus sp.]|uniref:helix-hairpin-helix domain-containing protein n=1 Tax=uncultured Tessaracoccus sp. TaxID=905023 RepID=UPI00262AB47A|nr:helix-hairpin-helix domain-containing protein [uncultured Tessaracoccus sp.]